MSEAEKAIQVHLIFVVSRFSLIRQSSLCKTAAGSSRNEKQNNPSYKFGSISVKSLTEYKYTEITPSTD